MPSSRQALSPAGVPSSASSLLLELGRCLCCMACHSEAGGASSLKARFGSLCLRSISCALPEARQELHRAKSNLAMCLHALDSAGRADDCAGAGASQQRWVDQGKHAWQVSTRLKAHTSPYSACAAASWCKALDKACFSGVDNPFVSWTLMVHACSGYPPTSLLLTQGQGART